ncbi:MAG: hypothetical protein COB92_03490 [Robiginitomaculum sp.]|nr:MAG: hypothetical protein COB92_03490 [Robiginitomaculum sp.]
MVKFIFGMIVALLVSTSTDSLAKQVDDTFTVRKQMASKMIYKSLADRDSSYGMAKYYAECSGMYNAIADKYDEDYKGNATSVEFRDKSKSVNVIANFYWRIHSNSHRLDIKEMSDVAYKRYISFISVRGMNNNVIREKMYSCETTESTYNMVMNDNEQNE